MKKFGALTVAMAFVCALLAGKDRDGMETRQESAEKRCNLSKVVQRVYCPECKKVCGKGDAEKGICKTCKGKVELAEVCIKNCYSCPIMHGSQKYHSRYCCGAAGCCVKIEVVALVIYKCEKCGASDRVVKNIKHDKCDGKIIKTCERSGRFPHGGEEEKVK
ncbi:MAG: hypothetical protein HY716_09005 [Planctomycetes bacterium]|nr:hypothetical protein [Planctomycetota bacterium]